MITLAATTASEIPLALAILFVLGSTFLIGMFAYATAAKLMFSMGPSFWGTFSAIIVDQILILLVALGGVFVFFVAVGMMGPAFGEFVGA